jgi:hypothetical protein
MLAGLKDPAKFTFASSASSTFVVETLWEPPKRTNLSPTKVYLPYDH